MIHEKLEQRQHYRINYPLAARPWLRIGSEELIVTELSEKGCRVLWRSPPLKGKLIAGRIKLYTGEIREISGEVGRRCGREVVLQSLIGLDFADMITEQRALIRDFPRFR